MNCSDGTHIRCCRKHRNSGWNWRNKSKHPSPVNFPPHTQLSARKLAARLWQLRFPEVSPFPLRQLESSQPCRRCSKEALSEASHSHVFAKIRNNNKLLGERKLIGDSVVTALLSELHRAQRCINKLKAEQLSFKKKLEEGKLVWKRRERHKVQAMLDDLRDKLGRERRRRERMGVLKTKLVHELAEAKLHASQWMMNYEEEKRERELIEQVRNELGMKIGEDNAKLEGLRRHSMKVREEMEQERKMFQMAELWREESIQMKLVDAKLALEDKYNQMIHLIAYLQSFLRSRGDELDSMELRDAQLIKKAAESANIQRVTQLSSDFTKTTGIFSICEEFREGKINESVIKSHSPPNLTAPSSTIHIVSLDEDHLNNNSGLHQSSTSTDYSTGLQVTNSWETVGHYEAHNQNFCLPPERRNTSLDNVNQDKKILGTEAECCENTDLEPLKTGVNGAFSVSIGQSKWKAFSASELLRSCRSDGTSNFVAKTCQYKRPEDGCYKHRDSVAQQNSEDLTLDECKGRLTTSSIQSGGITTTFVRKGSGEGGFEHWELLGQRNSTDTMNPHVTRGMKGCIEWSRGRGIRKTNSKVIPLEERVRKQKSQLQHMLKPQAQVLV